MQSPVVPGQPEIVSISRTLVSLYPKVDLSMTNAEKALAFQHNKTALASANPDRRARLLTLANHLNLMLTAESGLADWGCGACLGGSKSNAINLILRLFLYHFLHTMSS